MENLYREYIKQRDEATDELLKNEDISEYKELSKKSKLSMALFFIEIIISLIFLLPITIVLSIPEQVCILVWTIAIVISFITFCVLIYNYWQVDKVKDEHSICFLEKICKNKFVIIEENSEETEVDEDIPEELRYVEEDIEENCKTEKLCEEIKKILDDSTSAYKCELIHLNTLNLQKNNKNFDLHKFIFCETYREWRGYSDVYVLQMDVNSNKKLYLKENMYSFKLSAFEDFFVDHTDKLEKLEEVSNVEKYELSE